MTAKESISNLHQKYYGGKKGNKVKKQNVKVAKVIKDRKETDREIALRITQPKASGEAIKIGGLR